MTQSRAMTWAWRSTAAGLVAVWLGLLAASALAGGEAAEALMARLQPLESMTARFVQQVTDAEGQLLQEGSGEMAAQRPHRMRWSTEEPFHYLVITDGQWLWRYDADLEQANREPFDETLTDAPGLLFGEDPQRLVERYTVRRQGEGFVLEPHSPRAPFRRLELHWAGPALQAMILVDRLDQTTRIEFEEVRINPELAAGQFEFTPPEEADVILHD